MPTLYVRLFSNRYAKEDKHSFMMGFDSGGISTVIATLECPDTTTFKELRPLIEYQKDNLMLRRTSLYQELLFLCQTTSNPFNISDKDISKYRFGKLVAKEGVDIDDLIPTLIPLKVM